MVSVIDETRSDIAKIIARDFGQVAQSDICRTLLDWVHYRARRIPCHPRRVVLSREVQAKIGAYPAIKRIEFALTTGADVSAWLSRKIASHSRSPRADMMFNAWQISHFHLGQVFSNPNMVLGTNDLLYANVTAECVTMLDVRPHKNWTAQDLLRILLETRPEALEKMELKGITAAAWTDTELEALRSKGNSAPVAVAGRVFCPALGIATSGHAMRLNILCDGFWIAADTFKEAAKQNKLPRHLATQIASLMGVPVRLGAAFDPRGALSLYDKERRLAIYQTRIFE